VTRRLARWLRGTLADTTPLRTLDFRRLWLAGTVTVIGAQLTIVAVPKQIYDLTHSSGYVGLTGLFGLVPLVVFGLWGGAIADAMDRRTLLLITGTGIGLVSLVLWVVAASGFGNVWLILGLFAVQQALFAINQPTRTAVLPRLLPPRELAAANALNMTVFQFGAIVGPMLAGALLPLVGCPRCTWSTPSRCWPRCGPPGDCPGCHRWMPARASGAPPGCATCSTASGTWPPRRCCWCPSWWTSSPWRSGCRARCSRRWRR
jgi:MFS family permease